ncbi:MAG: lysine-sensitive aspartokinase 3 [Pyrinomonadaceae bacterium]|nr:lysine-sensitive aspartokinase 3 [Pyrinomonadaceae bacterium]
MKPIILKLGGTSVEDAGAFRNVAQIVARAVDDQRGLRPVVVVSAMSGFTDALLASVQDAREGNAEGAVAGLEPHFARHRKVVDALLSTEPASISQLLEQSRIEIEGLLRLVASESDSENGRQKYYQDAIVSFGERLSAALLAAVLRATDVSAEAVDARKCIITDDNFGSAAPLMSQTLASTRRELQSLINSSVVPVLGGFIGSTAGGQTTTLGRGGSDYTAAILGAALGAHEIQIWTDVSGVLTADPRVVPNARSIPRLSFAEAAELAYFGAKVLHPKTLQPAVERDIPVRICNSRAPQSESTLVGSETEKSPQTVKSIAHKTRVTTVQITSARMLGAYGFLRALFEVFDKHRTAVDVVTTSEVSVSLSLDDTSALPAIVEALQEFGTVSVESGRAIVCIVGEGLRSTPGIAARIFSTISDINVSLISQGASRINLTFAVEEARAAEAVRRLHQEFFETSDEENATAKGMASAVEGRAEVVS